MFYFNTHCVHQAQRRGTKGTKGTKTEERESRAEQRLNTIEKSGKGRKYFEHSFEETKRLVHETRPPHARQGRSGERESERKKERRRRRRREQVVEFLGTRRNVFSNRKTWVKQTLHLTSVSSAARPRLFFFRVCVCERFLTRHLRRERLVLLFVAGTPFVQTLKDGLGLSAVQVCFNSFQLRLARCSG